MTFLTLLFTAMGTSVLRAQGNVAKVGDTEYAKLADAVNAAQADDEIKVIANIATNLNLTISKKVTLDLGGFTLSDAFIKIASDVTIKNGEIVNTNEPYPLKVTGSGNLTVDGVAIEASKSDRAIWLAESSSVLNFKSGSSILATKGTDNTKSTIYGVWVAEGATANIYGGTITVDAGADATAVAIFGNYVNTVNIYGGKISTSGKTYSYAVWVDGDVTITGGEIVTNEKQYGYSSGITYGKNYAINSKGDVEISGDTKITTYGPSGYIVNAGGSNQEVVITGGEFTNVLSEVDKTAGGHSAPNLIYGSSVDATIEGGDFNGYKGEELIKGTGSTLTITGGSFDNKPKDDYVEVGATITVGETTYTKTEDGLEVVIPVASVNGTSYTDLQDAIVAAAPSGTVEILSDVTVDKWIMFSETLNIGSGQIITMNINGLTINGNGKTVTIKDIESAGNGGYLIFDATNLNVKDLTINYADGLVGGIGLSSGTISNVTFNGGNYGVFPGANGVTIEDCTFNGTKSSAVYYEEGRQGIVVENNFFNTAGGAYAITMRSDEQFTGNIINKGRVNIANSSSATVTGNDFGQERFKVYNAATATIENNEINVLAFNDESVVLSTFGVNTLSTEAQAVLDAASFPVAQIGATKYGSLQAAVDAAQDGEEIDLLKDVELTSTLLLTKNNILDGNDFMLTPAEGFTYDGNNAVIVLAANMSGYEANRTYTVKNLTIKGFSTPSRIVRANFCDATIQNCLFNNNTSESIITSAYAVLNVEDNTFTNNTASFAVINVGSDVSDGTNLVATIKDNTFENNHAAIAGIFLASSADVIDNHFKNNTHTGDNANAAAILAGPYTGNMPYTVNINRNAFENAMSKGGAALPSVFAEDWSSLGSTTSFDLSLNYWDGNKPEAGTAYKTSGENPQVTVKSYYTTYTDEILDGLVELPQGNNFTGYTRGDAIWGEVWGNATESFVIKVLNANGNVMGTTSLNNVDGIINGNVNVTWSLMLDAASNTDEYWTMNWTTAPSIGNMPAKVELWVDGVKVSGGNVVLNGPDEIQKIYAAVTDAEGKILSYHTSIAAAVAVITNTRSNPQGYIALLRDTDEAITLPADITFNGNGKAVGNITAEGTITFNGHTKATSFNVEYANTTVNIVEGACLEITPGAGRMVIGHGCIFNITGTITDAKNANVADLTPSLIMPGASFTGPGVTFNVTNAYISAPSSYCSSSSSASGTFDFNITNSIWESAGKLAFEAQSTAATVNFELKDSKLTTGSHLVFGVSRGEVVIDNSNVNVGTSRQIENRSTMTVKNGSVVNGAVATSSNAKNPGTLIVDNATYAVTGEFSGSDLGTGTIVYKNGATISAGSITKANIQIDATGMAVGNEVNITANLANLAGTIEVINNIMLDAKIVDGKIVIVDRTLQGEGTEENPYLINNLSDLVFFRDHVNAGETRYNATGVWVALANDIDMTDIANWTPIGNVDYNNKYIPQGPVFVGVFNGNGKVISNLKVASTVGGVDTQANVGLFGITGEGAVIKNLTLTNVTINTDGRNVGALAGFAYKATLENITVNGDIQIKGGNNVSGVAGMTRHYAMSATNIAVKGNDGSVIEGNNIIGGITAEIAPNGSAQTFKDLSVENVAIKGVSGVGGIVGLLTLGTVENVSVKDVALTGKTEYQGDAMGRIRLGSVAGLMGGQCATIINPTVENVTAKNLDGNNVVLPIIGANYDASSNATEARIGDTYYATLKHAIAAAQEDETTIVMIADAEVSETVRVEAGQKITLDLNGKTIDGTEKVRIALMSYGDLTIKDSTEEKNGMIKAGIGTAGNTVNICQGTFTLESGNIYSKNNAILIDDQTATVNINGGTITAEPTTNNSAAFYISSTSDTEVNITAGTMKGFNGILLWNNTKINITGGSVIAEGDLAIQGNGSRDNTEINISGENTIITGKDAAIYHPQGGKLNISGGTITGETGIVVKGGVVTISGGTINGTGAYTAYAPVSSGYQGTGDALYVEHYDNSTDSGNYGTPVVTVTGGTFNSTNAHPIASYANPNNASNGVEALAKFISGGTFNKVVEESLLAAGYALTENNGMYEVSFADYIVLPSFMNENNYEDYFGTNTVTDGTNYYATLQAAVEAVVGQADAILYCKPGADVGSLQHAPVTSTLTVNGNDAYVSGGAERDFDLGNTDPSYGQDITSDMTLTVKYLDGCGAWGAKATEHTVNLVFENCHNMGKVFVTGTTGTLNITMNNCAFEGVISEALYSNADGTIALTDVAFSNLNKAVNLNHKAAGTQTVTMTRCTFTNCGNDVAADQIPVRVLTSVEGGSSELTVTSCTFTGTPAGGADILLDYGVGLTEATITETNAKVVIERKNNEPEVHNVVDTQEYAFNNLPFVAEVDGTQFTSLQAAIDAADGKTVVVLDNITLTETVTVAAGTTVTLDLNGKTVSQTKEQTTGYQMILNDGNLTIVDNTNEKLGKISYTDSGNGGEYVSNTITNRGTITVKSGTIENLSSQTVAQNGYPYAIDSSIWGDASEVNTIVEGGKVHGATYSAIRLRADSNSEPVNVTVSGGEIVGTIEVQVPSSTVAGKGALVISGGKLSNSGTSNVLFFFGSGASAENIEVSVTGGEFTGNITISSSYPIGDNFNKNFITGGTFSTDVNEYCHEYYDAIQGADNLWRVEQVLFAQTTALQDGWNWFSSYVDLSTPDGLGKLQTALDGNGVQIKTQGNQFSFYQNNQWNSSAGFTSLYNEKMYMIQTTNDVNVELIGSVIDYANTVIVLNKGWNWISYPLDVNTEVNEALKNMSPSEGDIIKGYGDNTTSVYYTSDNPATPSAWWPSITLNPGQGYMYQSNTNTSFTYAAGNGTSAKVDSRDNNYWVAAKSQYANNMTIIAMLSIDNEIVKGDYEIAAFANGECRGSARPIYNEYLDAYILLLTVYGDDVEELTFKYYDIDTDTEYELSNVMNYSNDAIVGTLLDPYIFSMNILGIGENSIDNINIYPNPTTTDREINLQATCDKVEVFNALGVKVAEYHNVDTLDAFETAGIYVIRITNDNAVKHCRLVVK